MEQIPGPSSTATIPPSEHALAAFKQLFPGVIQDGVLDAARLGEALGIDVAGLKDGKERFGLMWAGKHKAVEALQAPSYAALVPDIENSVNWDTAENVFIEGDNLEVLKLLQNAYNDQVKLIYIDPPYNTGNDFVYNDDFSDPLKHYLEVTGQVDAEGNRLVANTEVSGRKHSNWLTMMYPRLVLARNLLTQDGSIFVSIDDNEVNNLRSLMDEVFGPENFIGQLVWAAGRKNDAKFISTSHEYVLVYSRNFEILKESVGEWKSRKEGLDDIYAAFSAIQKKYPMDYPSQELAIRKWFSNLDDSHPAKRHKHYRSVDSRGLYFGDNAGAPDKPETRSHRPLIHPVTGNPTAVPAKGWRWNDETLDRLVSEGQIHFGKDEANVPQFKGYLVNRETEAPYSVFYTDGRGATKRLRELLGGEYFDFPKDEQVLAKFIEFATEKTGIVLDFFAGSGTTGHAVTLQNARDGGNRKYILVTLDEPTEDKSFARKQGIEKISDITLKRLRAVHNIFPGTGFRTFRLSASAFKPTEVIEGEFDFRESSITLERSSLEISAELLLKLGAPLDSQIRNLELGYSKCWIAGRVLIATERPEVGDLVSAAQDHQCQTVAVLEDTLAGADDLKANLYYALKKANIAFRTY